MSGQTMDYRGYEVEDLIKDPFFKKSVMNPDDHSAAFWTQWTSESPSNRNKYEQARLIVIALHESWGERVSEEEIQRRIIHIREARRLQKKPTNVAWQNGWRWAAAAALLVVVFSAVWWVNQANRRANSNETAEVSQGDESRLGARIQGYAEEVVRENNTESDLTLMLSDSSVVTLRPGSRLKFPSVFGADDRKVLLSGDAFFEVTSNPDKPFLVYAMETVVKVLGTSFRVTALEIENKVTVKVLSGRVSVYSFSDFSGNAKAVEMGRAGVLLVPNEEVVMNGVARTIEKSAVAPRLEEARKKQYRELIFDDTPISDIFEEMARAYGIEIEFDQKAFSKCPITTYFMEETLLERINTICEAVGATYRPENGKIIVSGIDCTGL